MPKDSFEKLMQKLIGWSQDAVHMVENGSLQRYVLYLLVTALVFTRRLAVNWLRVWQGNVNSCPCDAMTAGGIVLLAAMALAVSVLHHQRITALLFTGATGLFITIGFARFSAPDPRADISFFR